VTAASGHFFDLNQPVLIGVGLGAFPQMEGNALRVTVMSVETKIASTRPNQTGAAIVVPSAIGDIVIVVFSKFYPSAIAQFSMC